MLNRSDTPYGIEVGVVGNWAMAAFDLVLSAVLCIAHRRFEFRRQ